MSYRDEGRHTSRSPVRRQPPPAKYSGGSHADERAIFVGNLPSDCTYEDIVHMFEPFSELSNIDMKQDFAFVFLANPSNGDDAVRKLDRSTFMERRLRVEWAKGNGRIKRREADRRVDAENIPNKTLFVVNFSRNTKDRDLQALFEPFGKISRVDIRNNYAFVEFENLEDAKAAKRKLHMTRLDHQVITVEYQAEKKERDREVVRGDRFDNRNRASDRGGDRYGGNRGGGRSRTPERRHGRSRSRSRSPRDRFGRDRGDRRF